MHKRYQTILPISVHIMSLKSKFFGSCCQAEHTDALCSGYWLGCVLTTNKPLQGSNGTEPRPPLLGDLGSDVLFRLRVRLLCAHMSKRSEPAGKRPRVSETSPFDPGVKAPQAKGRPPRLAGHLLLPALFSSISLFDRLNSVLVGVNKLTQIN